MSDRIFIGEVDGRQLFRIALLGKNAENLADPAVFSSDSDYLKVHAMADMVMNKWSNSGLRYYSAEFGFPDLGYIPMIFPSIGATDGGLNARVFFPNDRAPETNEMNNFFEMLVWRDRIWVCSGTGVSTNYDYRFRCIIFKNRLV